MAASPTPAIFPQLWEVDDADLWKARGDFTRARRWEVKESKPEPGDDDADADAWCPRRFSDSVYTPGRFSCIDGYSQVRGSSILNRINSEGSEGIYGMASSSNMYDNLHNVLGRRRPTVGDIAEEAGGAPGECTYAKASPGGAVVVRRASDGDVEVLYSKVKSQRARAKARAHLGRQTQSKSYPTLPHRQPTEPDKENTHHARLGQSASAHRTLDQHHS